MVVSARSYTQKRGGRFKLRSKEEIIKYIVCGVKDTYNLILKVIILLSRNPRGLQRRSRLLNKDDTMIDQEDRNRGHCWGGAKD